MADVNGVLLLPMGNEQRVDPSVPARYSRVKIYSKSRWERAAGGFHQPREKRVTFDRNIFSRVYPDAGDFRGGEAYLQFIATRSEPAAYATDGWSALTLQWVEPFRSGAYVRSPKIEKFSAIVNQALGLSQVIRMEDGANRRSGTRGRKRSPLTKGKQEMVGVSRGSSMLEDKM
ncbi:hypothetical protein K0M31_013558 [Melipona bicolor]|uniref:Uncharacterized protein n=1 Tax=Melipona bicolor TaxID=60889 RepID=A0AA40FHE6_9HYME|nr:hypothetical protein K0M31_013558 [Melipona bicolor]